MVLEFEFPLHCCVITLFIRNWRKRNKLIKKYEQHVNGLYLFIYFCALMGLKPYYNITLHAVVYFSKHPHQPDLGLHVHNITSSQVIYVSTLTFLFFPPRIFFYTLDIIVIFHTYIEYILFIFIYIRDPCERQRPLNTRSIFFALALHRRFCDS